MSLGKLWPKLSDAPDEPSKISELVTSSTPKHFFVAQQKIKSIDFVGTKDPVDRNPKKSFDLASILRDAEDISDPNVDLWAPAVSTYSKFKQNYVEFQQSYMGILNEVKHEAEQARSLDSDIEKIKNEAYDEFAVVMKEIYDAGVSMPEVTWNEDGSLDIGWPLKTGGTSTILVYGDDHMIYNTYLGSNNYVESICKISDGLLLPKLIGILSNITE